MARSGERSLSSKIRDLFDPFQAVAEIIVRGDHGSVHETTIDSVCTVMPPQEGCEIVFRSDASERRPHPRVQSLLIHSATTGRTPAACADLPFPPLHASVGPSASLLRRRRSASEPRRHRPLAPPSALPPAMSNLPMHPYGMQQLQMQQLQMQAQAQAMHHAHQQMQQQQQQMQYYPQQQQQQGSPDDRKLDTSSQLAMLEAQHAALQAQYTAEAQMHLQQQQAQMRHQQMQAAAASGSPVEYAAAAGSEGAAKPRRAPRPAPTSGTARAGSEVSAGQGPGTSLGEILVLAKRFEKVSNDDPRTKLLYTVCFPYFSGTIPERTAKKSLRLFNGWGTAEMRAAARIRLAEHAGDADLLRKLARLLDLSHEGTADELCARLEDWLASPSAVVHAPKDEVGADGKKKRKASEKKEKQKRPPNPYLLFANEKREEVVRSKPDLLVSTARAQELSDL